LEKIDTKEKTVGVTITPVVLPNKGIVHQNAVISLHERVWARKRAGILLLLFFYTFFCFLP